MEIEESSSQLEQMKYLNEAVGVPKNIIPVAKEVHSLLTSFVKEIPNPLKKYSGTYEDRDFVIASENDLKQTIIKQVEFSYSPFVKSQPRKDICNCIGISMDREQRIEGNRIVSVGKKNCLRISIHTEICSNDCSQKQLVDCVLDYCTVPVIAHELKHKFDTDARRSIEFKQFLEYQAKARALMSNSDILFIKAFHDFLFKSYFVSDIESSVHAVELAAEMSEKKIKKVEFYKFFRSSPIYQQLQDCKSYTFVSFVSNLHNDQDKIDNLLEINGFDSDLPDQQKVEEAIKLFTKELLNASEEYISSIAHDDKDQKQFIKDFAKSLKLHSTDPFAYFKKSCDAIAVKGEKVFKKIAKIYSLAESVEPRIHCAFLVPPRRFDLSFADYYKRKQK